MPRDWYHGELDELQRELLKMSELVETSIYRAVKSLAEKNIDLAHEVMNEEHQIDEMEGVIEQHCLRLLALQQPMASDLRFIGTALKIVTDLERMADHAFDIAKVTVKLSGQPLIKPLVDIPRMAAIAREMTRSAIDAYGRQDVAGAKAVIALDDQVDRLYDQILRELLTYMMASPQVIAQAIQLLFVAGSLERIADHATNLGEWIIYMVTGERPRLNDSTAESDD
jgi:phosphate transport system protein